MQENKSNVKTVHPVEKIPDANKQHIDINEQPIVSPTEWREKNYNIRKIKLPSGIIFKVKNVDLTNMAMSGTLSLPLLDTFFKSQEISPKIRTEKPDGEDVMKDFSAKDFIVMKEMIDRFTLAAVIEPKLTEKETGDEDTIPVTEIDFGDKLFIFQNCMRGGAANFAGFFREQ